MRENSYKLTQALPGFQLVINPAVKNGHDKGRPKNGMFIAIPESIKSCVTDVSPNSWRIQAVTILFGNRKVLLINSYFPTDPRRPDADEAELLEVLGHIQNVIRSNAFDSLLWAGDINADFARNSSHSNLVNDWVLDLGLSKSWEHFEVDFTHCHEQLDVSHVSVLDHFFWSESLGESIVDAGVLHLPANKSDHSPIYFVAEFQNIQHEPENQSRAKPKPSWKRASQDEKLSYKNMLEVRVSQLEIPESITSVLLHSSAHGDCTKCC